MAQFALPASDILTTGWATHTGATVSLSAVLDADATTFVTQQAGNVNNSFEVRLASVPQPLINRAHVVRYTYRKNAAAGNARNLQVVLLQDATIIAQGNLHSGITALWTEGAFLLSPAEAAAITDYTNLRLRFTASGATGGNATARRTVQVAFAQLRVPDWQPTYENQWGAAEDTSTPGVVRYVLDGVTGEGPRAEDALVDLWEKRQIIEPRNPIFERRWRMAYYSRKQVDYADLRNQIVARTYNLPPHQTQADALAIVDDKQSRFAAITTEADAGDRNV